MQTGRFLVAMVGLREGLTEGAEQRKCGALAMRARCFAGGYITMYLPESTELCTTTKGESLCTFKKSLRIWEENKKNAGCDTFHATTNGSHYH